MHLVTGGTGLLGSHLAEQLVKRGEPVRALVRPGSDTSFLRSLGVELHQGDLTDPASLQSGLKGVETVYHAASKVGDWGAWKEFRRDVIDATMRLLEACTAAEVRRLVLVSSTSAYGHPKPRPEPITEAEPLGDRFWFWDYYTRAKVAAERLTWDWHRRTGLPVTVIRPSWIYGPRDRTSIFRLARSLERGRVWILGDGSNRLNSVYAGNVAEACLLAARNPAAVGQAYNITADGFITQCEFLNLFADQLGLPRPRRRMPYPLAFGAALVMEALFRLLQRRRPPLVTRYAIWLLGRRTDYSTAKVERELGWKPTIGYEEGTRLTAEWFRGL